MIYGTLFRLKCAVRYSLFLFSRARERILNFETKYPEIEFIEQNGSSRQACPVPRRTKLSALAE